MSARGACRPAALLGVLAAAAMLGACAGQRGGAAARAAPSAAAAAAAVRFLLVNDVYVLDTLRDGSGGLARVAWTRDSLARDGPLVFVLAGDVLSPSLLSKWYAGRQMVEGFNAAKLDYATFGNHEFEIPRDTLLARIAASRFRWISTNCTQPDGSPFPGVLPWDTLTLAGTRIGLFGLTLRAGYPRWVRCADPDSTAHATVAALRSAGAELVIALTHQFIYQDTALLAREPDLDLILGGHEHDARAAVIGGRRVLKADASSRSAQWVTLRRGVGGAGEAPRGWRQESRLLIMGRGVPADPATAGVTRAWTDTLLHRLGPERVVGTTASALDARDAFTRRQEMPFGDLVADAVRLGTGADVGLLNSGTLRLDDVIDPGPVTNYVLESIFLFANETRIVTFPLTGARLREVLEHSVAGAGTGGFLQVSGVAFRYDPGRLAGQRIVGDLTRPDGRPVRADDTLSVAFGVYSACQGGDAYAIPEASESTLCRRWAGEPASLPRAVDLLIEHISRRLGGTIGTPPAGRIVRTGG
ncbi:MAG: bifunctional metallophosphatase/5'-nucleotidase [Gemmatimonadaceae bacterium]